MEKHSDDDLGIAGFDPMDENIFEKNPLISKGFGMICKKLGKNL